jgi:hypothetical protein
MFELRAQDRMGHPGQGINARQLWRMPDKEHRLILMLLHKAYPLA